MKAQALADEIKRLARHLQAAAFSHGYEDAHPSNAWSRQEKAAKVSADKLDAVSQAIDRIAAMAQPLRAREALELIATPQRPDGSWNRDREACRRLAAEALGLAE